MAIFQGPLSKHLFVCALLNFLLCSITFGTLRAAADPTRVQLECGALYHVVMTLIFLRLFSVPCIVMMCLLFKHLSQFALILDIYVITILLCIEVMVSSMQLTQFRCYDTLKTDPSRGTAVFVYAMALLITVDTLRLVYFASSRESPLTPSHQPPTDEEIELLLTDIDDDAPATTKPKPPAPPPLASSRT